MLKYEFLWLQLSSATISLGDGATVSVGATLESSSSAANGVVQAARGSTDSLPPATGSATLAQPVVVVSVLSYLKIS